MRKKVEEEKKLYALRPGALVVQRRMEVERGENHSDREKRKREVLKTAAAWQKHEHVTSKEH